MRLIAHGIFATGLLVFATSAVEATAVDTPAAVTAGAPFATAFQPYLDNHTLAGAVCLVATEKKILDEEAFGFADVENKRPMRDGTEFWIASETKPMTTTVFMMLVEEGKARLDDPVEKYLPEFKGQLVRNPLGGAPVPSTHPMLIRELLNHTSGLPFAGPMENPSGDAVPLAVRVKNYAGLVLQTQPGARFFYSSAGLNTVGRIIEVICGEPYEKVMQERLLTPMGMTRTTFWPHGDELAGPDALAETYLTNGHEIVKTKLARLTYPLDRKDRYPMPAGGLFSTAGDVLKFARMILAGGTFEGRRYLSPTSIRLMTTLHTTAATGGEYGYGWHVGDGTFAHDGADNTRLEIDLKRGAIEIFMVQYTGGWAWGAPDMKTLFSAMAEKFVAGSGTAE